MTVGHEARPTSSGGSHDTPPEAMVRYLQDEFGGPVTPVGRAPGASHSGWVFDVGRDGQRVVLRAEPRIGPFLDYDIMREVRLLQRMAGAGVPVPSVLASSSDTTVCGTPFAVLEWVEGDVLRPDRARRLPAEVRRRIAAEVVGTMATIHRVRPEADPELSAAGDGASARVLEVHGRILDEAVRADAVVVELTRTWLADRSRDLPPDEPVMVHGDLRLGNMVWRGEEVVACLDWETAGAGSRWFDLTWACMGAVDDDDIVLGLVTRRELLDQYAETAEVPLHPELISWWQVASAWARACTEVRLLDLATRGHGEGIDPARSLVWEFGSHRTDAELLALMDAHDRRWGRRARG